MIMTKERPADVETVGGQAQGNEYEHLEDNHNGRRGAIPQDVDRPARPLSKQDTHWGVGWQEKYLYRDVRTLPNASTLQRQYSPAEFDERLALLDVELRHNTRSSRIQYRRGRRDWQDYTDLDAAKLRADLASLGEPFGAWPDMWDQIFTVMDLNESQFARAIALHVAHRQVDPLIDYLENVAPRWDRIPRLSVWIRNVFDLPTLIDEEGDECPDYDNEDLAGWAGTFVFLGAVQRAYLPGAKLDEMPVFIGPGGIGKSTALREMFPPNLQDLFTDGLNLASEPQQRVEALQGRAVVEIGEMAGARRADIESLKAFLSRTDDGSVRLAYRHNPEPMPRRAVVVGTADRNDPLPPDHNLRRFVPVTLDGGNVGALLDFMDRNRGQLWAEALAMFDHGDDARLPDALKEVQSAATAAARATDPIGDAVDRFLENAPDTFTLEDIARAVGLIADVDGPANIKSADATSLGKALRMAGYEKRRGTKRNDRTNAYVRK